MSITHPSGQVQQHPIEALKAEIELFKQKRD
jgi:hypothetical protein